MMPTYIDHIVIIVKDIERTAQFYRVFLGDWIEKNDEQVVFQTGETKLFFGLPYTEYMPNDKDAYGLNHYAFGVHTLDELKELEGVLNRGNIKNSGLQKDRFAGKEFIWFDDPDGYRLEFYLRSE